MRIITTPKYYQHKRQQYYMYTVTEKSRRELCAKHKTLNQLHIQFVHNLAKSWVDYKDALHICVGCCWQLRLSHPDTYMHNRHRSRHAVCISLTARIVWQSPNTKELLQANHTYSMGPETCHFDDTFGKLGCWDPHYFRQRMHCSALLPPHRTAAFNTTCTALDCWVQPYFCQHWMHCPTLLSPHRTAGFSATWSRTGLLSSTILLQHWM